MSLNESTETNGKSQHKLGGIFTEFDKKNRNDRIYTADRFIPCLNELNERISGLGAVYGEFDHPDVFDTSLSRASHIITKANYVEDCIAYYILDVTKSYIVRKAALEARATADQDATTVVNELETWIRQQ